MDSKMAGEKRMLQLSELEELRHTRMRRYIRKRRKSGTTNISQGKSLRRVNKSSYLTPDSNFSHGN